MDFLDFNLQETVGDRQDRGNALKELEQLSFPTSKDEEWRFISLKGLSDKKFSLAKSNKVVDTSVFGSHKGIILTFVNGSFNAEASDIQQVEGLHIEVETLEVLTSDAFKGDFFEALNRSSATAVVKISIDKNKKIDTPIFLHHLQNADELSYAAPRVHVEAGAFAEAVVIEHFASEHTDQVYYNNPFIGFKLDDQAQIRHYRVQRDSKSAYHIGRVEAQVGASANYSSYSFNLGAKLARNDIRAVQNGLESHFALDALTMISGNQVSDTHTVMDHRFAHGTSHQLHKVLADDKSHSVFNGKIFVRQDAQKIDSFQENRNILLSDHAKVNTKPQLEIFADDVKCSHGATIGQLEDEELFYLQSRGLNINQARLLITKGFALEVIEEVEIDSLRELLAQEVDNFVLQ